MDKNAQEAAEILSEALSVHDELEKSFPCEILYLDGEDELDVKFDKVLTALGIEK